jgi:Zn-finger in ubiquitin-hydrolases and other protein
MLASVAAPCEHVDEVRTDWGPVLDPVCEDCARAGEGGWVSLRRCLTCGHVGCCDSSPGHHATEHHRETGHPTVQTLQPGQDWVWCYVDELTMRHVDGGWVEVDLFFEAGIGYMRDHLQAGGEPTVDESFTFGKGFPLGRWVAEMRRRNAARELTTDQNSQSDELPGWIWDG